MSEAEAVAVTLARLDERMGAMQASLNRIESGFEKRFEIEHEHVAQLGARVQNLEGWRNKIIGGLLVLVPAISFLTTLIVQALR